MPDCQSKHLKALDSAGISRLRSILNAICRETGEPLCGPAMQKIAALLIGLFRHGVTDPDKLLSVGRLALTQNARGMTKATAFKPGGQVEAP